MKISWLAAIESSENTTDTDNYYMPIDTDFLQFDWLIASPYNPVRTG